MSIKLTYTTGKRNLDVTAMESIEFTKDVEEIDLIDKRITSIVLTPLSACTNLRKLNLSENLLQNIDLAPIKSATNLHTLLLYENKLQNIDLSPVSFCSNLQDLDLSHNNLQNIDLSALKSCTNLQQLDHSSDSSKLRSPVARSHIIFAGPESFGRDGFFAAIERQNDCFSSSPKDPIITLISTQAIFSF